MAQKKSISNDYKRVSDYLKSFMPLTDKEFEEIAGMCEVRHFPKKHLILKVGEVEDHLNIIVKGIARKFVLSGKKEVTMQLATEGEFILSEISFSKREPSLVNIETIEPCIFMSIKHAELEQLFVNMPKAEKLGRMIVTEMYTKKDSQDFINLDKTIRERFFYYVRSHPHMLQRVPQKYIASYLNIKPETFSRLKHLLRNKPQP